MERQLPAVPGRQPWQAGDGVGVRDGVGVVVMEAVDVDGVDDPTTSTSQQATALHPRPLILTTKHTMNDANDDKVFTLFILVARFCGCCL